MRPIKFLKTFLIILLCVGFCFGQEISEDENWLKGLGTEADYLSSLDYPFTTFSEKDLTQGKQRLKTIRQFTPENEWEGIYYSNSGIGDSRLIWNSKGGFFNLYFYHYLKRFSYGTITESPAFVELVSEKSASSNDRKKLSKSRMIKVMFGEKHLLVPDNRLKDFCELAAGLNTSSSDIFYYQIKVEDMQKEVFGLPILPPEYQYFLRYPIELKIINVGIRKIIPNEQSTKEFNYDDIIYPVTLDAGKNKNIEINMDFFVEDLGEWIRISKVSQTKSVGVITRDFDENGREQCRDGKGGTEQIVSCKEIKAGMMSKTKTDNL